MSSPPPVAKPLYGSVIDREGKAVAEALVYVRVDDSTLLSSYTDKEGKWLITLNNARTNDLTKYIVPGKNSTVSVSVQGGNLGTSQGSVSLGDGELVPVISLGSNFLLSALSNKPPIILPPVLLLGLAGVINIASQSTISSKS